MAIDMKFMTISSVFLLLLLVNLARGEGESWKQNSREKEVISKFPELWKSQYGTSSRFDDNSYDLSHDFSTLHRSYSPLDFNKRSWWNGFGLGRRMKSGSKVNSGEEDGDWDSLTRQSRAHRRSKMRRVSICCRMGSCCKRRYVCLFVPRLRNFHCIPKSN